jgi:hypothetical protein
MNYELLFAGLSVLFLVMFLGAVYQLGAISHDYEQILKEKDKKISELQNKNK